MSEKPLTKDGSFQVFYFIDKILLDFSFGKWYTNRATQS